MTADDLDDLVRGIGAVEALHTLPGSDIGGAGNGDERMMRQTFEDAYVGYLTRRGITNPAERINTMVARRPTIDTEKLERAITQAIERNRYR